MVAAISWMEAKEKYAGIVDYDTAIFVANFYVTAMEKEKWAALTSLQREALLWVDGAGSYGCAIECARIVGE